MRKKRCVKGQLTVFILVIIIAIILILSFIFYRRQYEHTQPEALTPPEIVPLQLYVQSCMEDVAENAVQLMGVQGGYITIPPEILRKPQAYVNLDPQGYFKSPLWYYRGKSQLPDLNVIAQQFNNYMNEQLPYCVNNFTAFQEHYTVQILSSPKTVTLFTNEDIEVRTTYLLRAQANFGNQTRADIQEFVIHVPVRMKKILALAKKIVDAENEYLFMENVTIDLMAGHPDIPFTNLAFECGTQKTHEKWKISSLRAKVQELLAYNIPMMRVENTIYTPFEAPRETYESFRGLPRDEKTGEIKNLPTFSLPDDAYYYFHMLVDAGASEPSMRVGFSYEPRWGMYFRGNPSHNGYLKSKSARGAEQYLQFLCINFYHFTYDVVYPVQISITDTESYGGQGYVYSFFLPVQIKQNRGVREDIGVTFFDVPDQSRDLCMQEGNDVTIKAMGMFGGMYSQEISGVNISYLCISDYCELGITGGEDGHYQLRTTLPSNCAYPYILGEKQGYLPAKEQLLNMEQDTIEIPMKRLKKMNYEVRKNLYFSETGTLIPVSIPLDERENVTISLSVKNATYEQYASYPSPGSTIDLVLDEGIVYDVKIMGSKRGYAREYIFGGYDGTWSPSYDDVASSDTIIFNMFEFRPTPVTEKDQAMIANYFETGEYADELVPRLE